MIIERNVDLAPLEGWETAAAGARDVAFFTANWMAAYSVDSGLTFNEISPDDALKPFGLTFCCDQSITYIPSIDCFVWIILSDPADDGSVVMAVASPEEIKNSGGRAWTVYPIRASAFNWQTEAFDYPDLCFGDNFAYLTFDATKHGGAVVCRMILNDIRDRGNVHGSYFYVPDSSFICPAQSTGNRGLFGTMQDTSRLRVFDWPESGSAVTAFDVPIWSVPSEDWNSFTPDPDHDDWLLPSSKIWINVTGAARAGQELWLAWSAGRRVSGQPQNAMPQPHIEMAVINIDTRKLVSQPFIWTPDVAWAWPSLAANERQEVAISCAMGGGATYPEHVVGTLSVSAPFLREFAITTSVKSVGSGGHFVRIRTMFPEVNTFVAGGFVGLKTGKTTSVNDPHYVVFRS